MRTVINWDALPSWGEIVPVADCCHMRIYPGLTDLYIFQEKTINSDLLWKTVISECPYLNTTSSRRIWYSSSQLVTSGRGTRKSPHLPSAAAWVSRVLVIYLVFVWTTLLWKRLLEVFVAFLHWNCGSFEFCIMVPLDTVEPAEKKFPGLFFSTEILCSSFSSVTQPTSEPRAKIVWQMTGVQIIQLHTWHWEENCLGSRHLRVISMHISWKKDSGKSV